MITADAGATLLIATVIPAIWAVIVPWLQRQLAIGRGFRLLIFAVALVGATALSIWMAVAIPMTLYSSLAIFLGFTIAWGVVCHLIAYDWGKNLSDWLGGDWWVKSIDYYYLVLSFSGLVLRVVLVDIAGEAAKGVNTIAVFLIGAGVALRITKTTIEIRGWSIEARRDRLEAAASVRVVSGPRR